MSEAKKDSSRRTGRRLVSLVGVLGFTLGVAATGLAAYLVMPQQMIVTKECRLGVDETVAGLEKAITEHGWVLSGIRDMNKSLEKQGVDFERKVRLVKLCHPEHAKRVLTSDRYVSSMMPCTIAVWEGDDGKTYLSQMNMGLMAKLFGGEVAEVMGGDVAREEHAIVADFVLE